MSTSVSLSQPQLQPNNWTDKKIKLLVKWRQQSRVYHWLHAKSSSYKEWWYVRIFYASAFLTLLGLGENFSVYFTEGTTVFLWLQIANAITLTIIGICNIYLKTSKIAELVEKHSNTAKDFYTLQTEIEEQLSQTPQDRDDGKIYMKKVRVKITALTKNSPEIIPSVWKKFQSAIENGEIFNESDPTIIYTAALSKMKDKIPTTADETAINISNPDIELTPVSITTPTEPQYPVTMISEHDLEIEQKDFDNRMTKSGKVDSKLLKALEYQMARFN